MTLLKILNDVKKWAPDLVAMPTRIRRLSEASIAEADKRTICRSCGTGRIGELGTASGGERGVAEGRCDRCGKRWHVNVASGVCLKVLD